MGAPIKSYLRKQRPLTRTLLARFSHAVGDRPASGPCHRDFLTEVSAHPPDAPEKTTLFSGGYSNRTRGYRRQHGLLGDIPPTNPAPEGDERAPLEARRSWARLIRQVYTVDPLVCPGCGGTMKIIYVIEQPAVIRQILEFLGLPT